MPAAPLARDSPLAVFTGSDRRQMTAPAAFSDLHAGPREVGCGFPENWASHDAWCSALRKPDKPACKVTLRWSRRCIGYRTVPPLPLTKDKRPVAAVRASTGRHPFLEAYVCFGLGATEWLHGSQLYLLRCNETQCIHTHTARPGLFTDWGDGATARVDSSDG